MVYDYELTEPKDILIKYTQRLSEKAAELAERKYELQKEIDNIDFHIRSMEMHSAMFAETLKRLS